MKTSLRVLLGLSFVAVGCSSSSSPATADASMPATDASHPKADASKTHPLLDTGPPPAHDAGKDSGSPVTPDAGKDSGAVVAPDAGRDAGVMDAAVDTGSPTPDAGKDGAHHPDAPLAFFDAGRDTGRPATDLAIVTVSGAPLTAAAGDAIPLKVVRVLEDGGVEDLPAGESVRWSAPQTVSAEDPNDAGDDSILPDDRPAPTAIFLENAYRPDRHDYAGTLFVLEAGHTSGAAVTVTALVGDGGTVSATVPVTDTPHGSADAGYALYAEILGCSVCHGATGGGSPAVDGGAEGGVYYLLAGQRYAYPAPALNNTSSGGSPNLAADPDWNAALLGIAAQGDIDNNGVALRKPMPDWLGRKNAQGEVLSAQDFAHIYAYLKTQRH